MTPCSEAQRPIFPLRTSSFPGLLLMDWILQRRSGDKKSVFIYAPVTP